VYHIIILSNLYVPLVPSNFVCNIITCYCRLVFATEDCYLILMVCTCSVVECRLTLQIATWHNCSHGYCGSVPTLLHISACCCGLVLIMHFHGSSTNHFFYDFCNVNRIPISMLYMLCTIKFGPWEAKL